MDNNLLVVAKELDEVLGLEPQISKDDEATLKAELVEAGELLEDGDEISHLVFDVLKKLGVKLPSGLDVKNVKPKNSKGENKGERTGFGHLKNSALGVLDDLLFENDGKVDFDTAIDVLFEKFSDRYPTREKAAVRVKRYIKDESKNGNVCYNKDKKLIMVVIRS